jgi:hypothetical protein
MTEKADRAQALLDDPLLQEAFAAVRERYRDLIEETPLSSSDVEALHDIRKMLHLLREVEKHLAQVVQDGHLEDFRALEHESGDLWQSKKH